MPEYLTIQSVAEKTGKSQKTIRRHIAAKKLKATKIQNKYRILPEDFEKWLSSGECDETKDTETFSKMGSRISMDYNDVVNWIDIKDDFLNEDLDGWNNTDARNGYNFIDLFSGAGGLTCGLTMAGFTPVASVEITKQAVETYKHNFIDVKGFDEEVETRDIREKEVKNSLYDSIGNKHIHLIVGGFPCQGFSLSGNRVVTDERNNLYMGITWPLHVTTRRPSAS